MDLPLTFIEPLCQCFIFLYVSHILRDFLIHCLHFSSFKLNQLTFIFIVGVERKSLIVSYTEFLHIEIMMRHL